MNVNVKMVIKKEEKPEDLGRTFKISLLWHGKIVAMQSDKLWGNDGIR